MAMAADASASSPPTLVWLRRDLRLTDNPALAAAVARGAPIIPVVLDPAVAGGQDAGWELGGASRVWLHQSLADLEQALQRRGSRLVLRGRPSETARDALLALLDETGAAAVMWNRLYEPAAIARDAALKAELRARGVAVEAFNGALLFEPCGKGVKTKEGRPFQIFTPFGRACLTSGEPAPPATALGEALPGPTRWPTSLRLEEFALLPAIDWASGIRAAWTPGEAGARARLDALATDVVAAYRTRRDRPDLDGTSRLSPHLHFGEIGPRQLWHALRDRADAGAERGSGEVGGAVDSYLRELGWREFAHHLLFHFPATVEHPMRGSFQRFPWAPSPPTLRAWQRGHTGYPLVDAGMRQLWSAGWMHNRVRMVVASFLVKDLLQPWQAGARWFWATLVDADLAQNTLGWQWSAGSGADAAPYFRVFNPVSQGRRFDPDGDYVRRWVPELAALPGAAIHAPWELPAAALAQAGVVLGRTYPERIVDHAWARERALAAYASIH
jgi:deoxyribodipyrimidine photo-lyase